MKFDNVLTGDTDGNICPQLNDDGKLIGDEDCLFLNVYTPEAIRGPQYPVMVYFHGGFFVKGSGSSKEAGPQYFLDRNIVLVTLNYRLGALGFLSTGNDIAPGNFGLKDQRTALQWVRDNIIAFGGDPNRVTIFGQDAGGFSTNLHSTADGSEGLFQQYIAQSSPADFLAFESTTKNIQYQRYTTALGKKLNCPTEDTSALIKCLRGAGVYDLVNSSDIFPEVFRSISTWTPTDESILTSDRFTYDSARNIIMKSEPRNIPSMVGIVENDGLLWTGAIYTNDSIYDRIRENPTKFFRYFSTYTRKWGIGAHNVLYGNMTEGFYLKDIDVNDRKAFSQAITDFFTDSAFMWECHFILVLSKYEGQTPGYQYSFDYRGTFSYSSLQTGNNDNVGAAHGDDLIYLFPMNPKLKTSSDLEFSESDEKMIDTMIDLWTSFASTGTPMTNSTSGPVEGKPYDGNVKETNYLQIGHQSDPEVKVRLGLRKASMEVWEAMFTNAYDAWISGDLSIG